MADDADPGALQMLSGDDSGSARCGQFDVIWTETRSFEFRVPGAAVLTVTGTDGQSLIDLSRSLKAGEKIIPLWCGDVLGDGSQALALETFSGGAHCCFSVSVILLQPGGPHLLDADLGNGGLVQPQQLDGSGPLELPATSDVFAYFADLSFAASPFMPLVFAYDGTGYVEATRQYPDRITGEVARAEVALSAAVARGVPTQVPPQFAYQEQQSVALRLYGLHVLLGDADTALPLIEAQVSPPVAGWLAANVAAARDAMAQRYDLGDD